MAKKRKRDSSILFMSLILLGVLFLFSSYYSRGCSPVGNIVLNPSCKYSKDPKLINGELDHCFDDASCNPKNQEKEDWKSCCDYTQGSTTSCSCKSNGNPCTDPKKCAACMAYAEAGGSGDPCMWAVLCSISNRVNDDRFPHKVCDVVSQGNGKQYNAYSCVCNSQAKNQKYCKCCRGELTGKEKEEYDKAYNMLNNFDQGECKSLGITHFNAAGQNSWASNQASCTKVTFEKCAAFDFYKC